MTELGRPAGRGSIRNRLIAAFGGIALVVFGAVGSALYWALASELQRHDREGLSGKVRMVRHFIDEAGATGDAQTLAHRIRDTLIGHADLRVWLVSPKSEVIVGEGPVPRPKHEADGLLMFDGHDGVPMEGIRADVTAADALRIATMIVAVDLRPRQRLLAAYRLTLWLVCSAGVLASIGLAAWSTRRGLDSVHRLSKEAASIAPASLSVRLQTAGVDAELQELVGAFNAALDRVETAYRHMEAFMADVAHELRTPLANLINAAQVTLAGQRDADLLRETLAGQLEELEALKRMVNDMLFLARADQGEQAPDVDAVDLSDEARKTLDFYEAMLHESGVSATVVGAARARVNAPLIRRALSNLVSNAIKHTAAGGRIEVRLSLADRRSVVEVWNPGPPIPDAVRRRMFDRFFRGDVPRGATGDGAGLGLAIVTAVAKMHGGDVFVHRDDGGNTVGLRLPAWLAGS